MSTRLATELEYQREYVGNLVKFGAPLWQLEKERKRLAKLEQASDY